jgi:hypothetical protein
MVCILDRDLVIATSPAYDDHSLRPSLGATPLDWGASSQWRKRSSSGHRWTHRRLDQKAAREAEKRATERGLPPVALHDQGVRVELGELPTDQT